MFQMQLLKFTSFEREEFLNRQKEYDGNFKLITSNFYPFPLLNSSSKKRGPEVIFFFYYGCDKAKGLNDKLEEGKKNWNS